MGRDREELRRLIRNHGFAALEDTLLAQAQPSVRVQTTRINDEGLIPVGQSKVGGRPDLPPDVAWPTAQRVPHLSLPFIAQFRLEDVREHDEEQVLPPSGLLSFFGDPFTSEEWRVLPLPNTSALQRREFPTDIGAHEEDGQFFPCAVALVAEINLTDHDDSFEYPSGETREDFLELIVAGNFHEPPHPRSVNRLLGVTYGISKDLRASCAMWEQTGVFYTNNQAVRR